MVYDEYLGQCLMTFAEWAHNHGRNGAPGFYERLLDGEEPELSIVKKYIAKLSAQYEHYSDLRKN